MKGLSIRQPWAWAILHAGKRIENRDWYCAYRGPILIHASSGSSMRETLEALAFMRRFMDIELAGTLQSTFSIGTILRQCDMPRGGIVGRARIIDCIDPTKPHALKSDRWYTGAFGLVLEDVEPLPFVPCRGSLGLWNVNDKVMEAISGGAT